MGKITEYMNFVLKGVSPTGLTNVWSVQDKTHGFELGEIKWFSNWRKYSFYPNGNTIWDPSCLRAIADFLEEKMKERSRGGPLP